MQKPWGGYREAKANYAGDKPLRLIVLYVKGGQSTNYGGPGAALNLQVFFRDAQTNKVYWKGEYKNSVKQTPFGGTKFDDQFVSEMLDHVFSDMEKSELLPGMKTAQLKGPGSD